jgi:hypothetical protein
MGRGVCRRPHDDRRVSVRASFAPLSTFSSVSTTAAAAAVAAVAFVAATMTPEAQGTPPVIDVPAGGSFQAALNQAQPGTTIRLTAGATYTTISGFSLPAKNGASFIVITTRDADLPPPGTRIDPSYKPKLATIRSASTSSAITTAAGASYFKFVGVAFEANKNGAGDIIALGNSTQTSLAQVPDHIEFDRVLITGDPTVGQKRGISVNATNVVIQNSDIRSIMAAGQDSQAIAGWNTNGPIVIRNNYLEAAGENIMFGGADIALPGAIPSDILVEDNVMTKNPAWRGTDWTVKNLFEIKNGRRITVRRNSMQYNWGGAQPGFAVVFTPRNSSKKTPWVVVEDVEFSGNLVAHSGSAFNILGRDDSAISGQLARLLIKDNLVYDITSGPWAGSGIFAQIGGEPREIKIDHNTIWHDGNIVSFYGGSFVHPTTGVTVAAGPIWGFVFTNNLLKHNEYGLFGSGQAFGNGALAYYAPDGVVQRNVIATDKSMASRYPGDNQFPTLASFNANFRSVASGDYRLVPTSAYLNAGTDGKDLGCEFTPFLQSFPMAPGRPRITAVVW